MSDINKKILQTLKDDELKQSSLNEQDANALDLIKESFHGKFKLTFIFVVVMQLLLAGFAIYATAQLLQVEPLGEKIEWSVAIIVSVLVFAIARIYFFLELNRLSILRELKRVELQIAIINEERNTQ
uniref:DUF6768 family protein n=1 Tax=Ningiella ruwaisensis TaxID=2364274 RepID=UPI0010A09649|nr:DUF6768 family protein [Ningiella ruwaisensis]